MYTMFQWQGSATSDPYIALASIDMSTSVNINTRMSMLNKLLPDHSNKKTAAIAQEFLMKIKTNKQLPPNESEAIPMKDKEVYDHPIPLGQKDVIDEVIVMKD